MVALTRVPSDWQGAILEAARMFMNAEVCFYREESGQPYNPVTGAGGDNGIAVFWRGKARVQHVRAPREFEVAYQEGSTRFFRFQLDPEEAGNSVPFLPAGVKARVLSGGRDSDLESLAFVVTSAINSSHKAVRTVELSANMKGVTWQWSPDTPLGLFPSDGLYPAYTLFPMES